MFLDIFKWAFKQVINYFYGLTLKVLFFFGGGDWNGFRSFGVFSATVISILLGEHILSAMKHELEVSGIIAFYIKIGKYVDSIIIISSFLLTKINLTLTRKPHQWGNHRNQLNYVHSRKQCLT